MSHAVYTVPYIRLHPNRAQCIFSHLLFLAPHTNTIYITPSPSKLTPKQTTKSKANAHFSLLRFSFTFSGKSQRVYGRRGGDSCVRTKREIESERERDERTSLVEICALREKKTRKNFFSFFFLIFFLGFGEEKKGRSSVDQGD